MEDQETKQSRSNRLEKRILSGRERNTKRRSDSHDDKFFNVFANQYKGLGKSTKGLTLVNTVNFKAVNFAQLYDNGPRRNEFLEKNRRKTQSQKDPIKHQWVDELA